MVKALIHRHRYFNQIAGRVTKIDRADVLHGTCSRNGSFDDVGFFCFDGRDDVPERGKSQSLLLYMEEHDWALQTARALTSSQEGKRLYWIRAGVEATISLGV